MVNVDDVRFPVAPRLLDDTRLDHVEHVGIAIVVVPDILLIELRQAGELVRRADIRHVPLAHHLLAIGVDRRPEHEDDVVENCLGSDLVHLRPIDEVVGEQWRVLGPCDFCRVQAAVDVHERLALTRELTRRRVGEPGGMRQALRNLAIALDLLEILRARNEREVHRPALARLAGLDEADVLARGRELAEIFDRLIVGRELEVGAGPESEGRVGRRNGARLRRENDGRCERPDNEHARRRLHRYPRREHLTATDPRHSA